MDNHIDDIEVIRQLIHLEEIIVLGKSYGAMAALGFTLRYPEAVSRLILAAGAPSFRFLETAKANLLARGTAEQQEACEKLWDGTFSNQEEWERYVQVMAPMYSFKIRHGEPIPLLSSQYPFSYFWVNRGFGDFLRQFDFEAQLHEIQCPTLLLVGEEDWITDKIHSQTMVEKIPNSQLIVFQASDHMMEIDVPELYFQAITEFIHHSS